MEKEALLKVAAGKRDKTLQERGRGREKEEGRTRGSEKRDERSAGGWKVEREGERKSDGGGHPPSSSFSQILSVFIVSIPPMFLRKCLCVCVCHCFLICKSPLLNRPSTLTCRLCQECCFLE